MPAFLENPLMKQYESLCAEVEREFARNRALYGDRMKCGPGCSECCHQLFQITEIEASVISRGVKRLDASLKRRMEERARPYLEKRRQLTAVSGEPEAWGNLPPMGTRLACPALEDGVCRIYEFRPLICRKFGMPLYNPAKPGRVYACELNFQAGEEISDPSLVQIQTAIHDRWKEIQGAYNDAGGPRDPEPISVARAILEDFSDLVP